MEKRRDAKEILHLLNWLQQTALGHYEATALAWNNTSQGMALQLGLNDKNEVENEDKEKCKWKGLKVRRKWSYLKKSSNELWENNSEKNMNLTNERT